MAHLKTFPVATFLHYPTSSHLSISQKHSLTPCNSISVLLRELERFESNDKNVYRAMSTYQGYHVTRCFDRLVF